MPLFGPPPKARRFEYKPRFYHPPEESEEEEGRKRIHFRGRFLSANREYRQPRKKSVVGMLLLLIIVIYMLFYLQGLEKRERLHPGKFKVEDIEVIDETP